MKRPLWRDWCFGIVFGIAMTGTGIEAQSPAAPGSCGYAPPGVQSLFVERTVMPPNLETTYDTSIPPNVLATLAAGALEIRERLVYDSKANVLTSTVFLVEPGSPSPTPINANISAVTLASYTISIVRVDTSCNIPPGILFSGRVISSSGGPGVPNGVFGLRLDGEPAAVSIGYTSDTPPQINSVVVMLAGVAASYSPAGTGTVTFTTSFVPTPQQAGPAVVLSINGQTQSLPLMPNNPIQVFSKTATLDASKSTDASGGALSFQWIANPPVSLTPNATVPAILVQFPSRGFSTTVTLTVTNSAGQHSVVAVPLLYLGP